jgi:hypothetical protein
VFGRTRTDAFVRSTMRARALKVWEAAKLGAYRELSRQVSHAAP